MNTRYSKLLLAVLLAILVVPPVVADKPPENGPHVEYYENGKKRSEAHYKNGKLVSVSVWKPDGKLCPITKIVDGSGILVDYKNGKKNLYRAIRGSVKQHKAEHVDERERNQLPEPSFD